jgi:hypothetical protein
MYINLPSSHCRPHLHYIAKSLKYTMPTPTSIPTSTSSPKKIPLGIVRLIETCTSRFEVTKSKFDQERHTIPFRTIEDFDKTFERFEKWSSETKSFAYTRNDRIDLYYELPLLRDYLNCDVVDAAFSKSRKNAKVERREDEGSSDDEDEDELEIMVRRLNKQVEWLEKFHCRVIKEKGRRESQEATSIPPTTQPSSPAQALPMTLASLRTFFHSS